MKKRHFSERHVLVVEISRLARSTLQVLKIMKAAAADQVNQHTREDRPRGATKKLSLDEHAKKIDEYLALGLNKRTIAKLLGASPNTLYEWLRRHRPETFAAAGLRAQLSDAFEDRASTSDRKLYVHTVIFIAGRKKQQYLVYN